MMPSLILGLWPDSYLHFLTFLALLVAYIQMGFDA
jgi:hypothetical protein